MWKAIKDEYPPHDTMLLVFSDGNISVAEYDSQNARWFAFADGELAGYSSADDLICPKPTHWMPLPEPPAKEK